MGFARMVGIQCKRAVWSPIFFITVCVVVMVLIFNSGESLYEGSSVIYIFSSSMLSVHIFTVCILPVLPFGISYAKERSEKSLRFFCVRGGGSGYAFSKFIAVAFSGFLVVFLGMALFGLIMSIWYPVYNGNPGTGSSSFNSLLENNHIFLYLFLYLTCFSLSGALFSALAYWFSTWYDERYSVVILPYLFYMTLEFITMLLGLPYRFKASPWFVYTPVADSPVYAVLMKFLFVGAALLLLSFDIAGRVERRLLHE